MHSFIWLFYVVYDRIKQVGQVIRRGRTEPLVYLCPFFVCELFVFLSFLIVVTFFVMPAKIIVLSKLFQ
jgi:hypothetical protein